MARATARAWSAAAPRTMSPPTAPQPKPNTETLRPVRPSGRVCMMFLPSGCDSRADARTLSRQVKLRPAALQQTRLSSGPSLLLHAAGVIGFAPFLIDPTGPLGVPRIVG